MIKLSRGFTLVELLVVTAVIGILATIVIAGFSTIQASSRDSERASKVKVIAESLEKYYDANGEYPSCSAMSQSAQTVSSTTLVGMDPTVLATPSATSGANSVTCNCLTQPSGGSYISTCPSSTHVSTDSIAYVGDGSTTCSTGSSCLQYTLQYREEATGNIISLTSRRTAILATSGAPTLSASPTSSTSISASWNAISNSTSYEIQMTSLSDTNFSSPLQDNNVASLSTSFSSLTEGTSYLFRVKANGASSEGDGTWSNTVTATTPVDAPVITPTITAAMSGTTAQATSSVVACPASTTTYYSFEWYRTGTLAAGTWSAWSTATSSRTYGQTSAIQGNQYDFRVQASCVGANSTSPIGTTSATATVVVPFTSPAAPVYAGPSSFKNNVNAVVTFSASCPSGTTPTSTTYTSAGWAGATYGPHPWGYNDWWTLGPSGGTTVYYYGVYQCTSSYGTSPMSSSSNVGVAVTP